MATYVSGSLRLVNGTVPQIFFHAEGGVNWGTRNISYECEILGGHIMVKYPSGIKSADVADEIFMNTKSLVENVVLTQIVMEGTGLVYTVEHCRRAEGKIELAMPDTAPPIADIQVDQQKTFDLMGRMPQLRYAARDFNQGLINREDCAFFFYRAIETLAKLICNTDKLTSQKWSDFHTRVGTTSGEMKVLHDINKKHRHGEHISFTRRQHVEMLRTTKYFMLRSIKFLSEENTLNT